MALPFFYTDRFDSSQKIITLDEDTSKHVVQVLRMKKGERLSLTDGKGNRLTAEITSDHKKHCEVVIIDATFIPGDIRKVTVGISLIKNTSRFEWFLEKAAEIGVNEIIPLICERTEKQKFRADRMQNILVSAMLQSQQCWLPVLVEPLPFSQVTRESGQPQKFIAHCSNGGKRSLPGLIDKSMSAQVILIGPEGDFTKEEIELAVEHQFEPVTLGENRLRTETAGIVAATIIKLS